MSSLSLSSRKLIFDIKDGKLKPDDEDGNDSDNTTSSPTTTPTSSTPIHVTPTMSHFVGFLSSNNLVTRYFGYLELLDKQNFFDNTFGSDPVILGVQPKNNNSTDCMERVHFYADKCMLKVFLSICHEDYVGKFDSSSKRKLVHKVCKNIIKLS